jgi:hypothetical protein
VKKRIGAEEDILKEIVEIPEVKDAYRIYGARASSR